MAAEDDNFFSRWSRRKVQVRTGQPLPVDPPIAPAPVPATAAATAPRARSAVPPGAPASPVAAVAAGAAPTQEPPQAPEAPPPLTLDDVALITPQGDFAPFMARQVPAEVRNAAVKKLFTDPHFNIMDGLDIYIDDYSKPSPLSAADMARMVGAQFLKLVDDPNEVKPVPAPALAAKSDVAEPVPGSESDTAFDTAPVPDEEPPVSDASAHPADGDPVEPPAEAAATPPTTEPHDDHADLQLQPDHAPERESPGRGAG